MQIIKGERMKYTATNPRPLPHQKRIDELLRYEPVNGQLIWKTHPNRTDLIGKPCLPNKLDGYVYVSIDGHKFKAHRVIYKLITGHDPIIIDHINGDKGDNRWHNLRNVTGQQNNMNMKLPKDNKSGEIGVFWHEKQNMWHATVRQDSKSMHLGSFKTKDEAVAARKAANKVLGFSDRHGDAA